MSTVITDPVCGRVVKDSAPYQLISKDKIYCFCGQACLQKFQQDVETYSQSPVFHNTQSEHSRAR